MNFSYASADLWVLPNIFWGRWKYRWTGMSDKFFWGNIVLDWLQRTNRSSSSPRSTSLTNSACANNFSSASSWSKTNEAILTKKYQFHWILMFALIFLVKKSWNFTVYLFYFLWAKKRKLKYMYKQFWKFLELKNHIYIYYRVSMGSWIYILDSYNKKYFNLHHYFN